MPYSLSRFSIRKQILIGYIPVLVVLACLAFYSYQNFKKFDDNFNNLQNITVESLFFLGIEKDIVELQRHVLVYSYVGYKGVIRKIEFLQNKLEKKFKDIEPIVKKDLEIKRRYDRMLGHYNKYKIGFEEAVKEKENLEKINKETMSPLVRKSLTQLQNIEDTLRDQGEYKLAYKASQIRYKFFQASTNIKTFSKSPDSLLVNETSTLIAHVQKQSSNLRENISNKNMQVLIDDFLDSLSLYNSIFKKIIRINRNYLNLINVVLAGKAAEIDTLSNELDVLMTARTDTLSAGIKKDIKHSQKQFIVLSILAGILGVLSSLFIAMGIAKPVRAMARTLARLADKEDSIEIPGQHRKDEVGQMARSANAFKTMALNLKHQTLELEEFSYRTSHDLRSPLVSSISLLTIVQDAIKDKNDEMAVKGIDAVKASLVSLENLVKDILELTKIKNIDEQTVKINIDEIVNTALKKIENMPDYDLLDIICDINQCKTIHSKKSRIVLIVENLISNAVKYQDTDKNKSFIKITLSEAPKNAILTIEDNGLGIPERNQKQLFNMFKRFHPKASFGSGLGLYMVKKSADIIEGQIQYEDTKNGSKFILTIPYSTH